jgi:hypothetical protein
MRGMTRKERLQAVYEGRAPDRTPVKLWGAEPGQACVHPAFEPVRDLAARRSDLVLTRGSRFHIYAGAQAGKLIETCVRPTADEAWLEEIAVYHTPQGDLRQVFLKSARKRPGYQREHPLKEPAHIEALLSMPYEPYPFSAESYREAEAALGDAGIVMFGLDHPLYALQRLIGSENFALWYVEAPDLLERAIETFARRVRREAETALAAGIRGAFAWVGPELCIPPLMPPAAFERFVFEIDKPLIDALHAAGGRVWVHCHGRMTPVLERFARMGVDVLNPIEPPPMGDISLPEAFARVGERMALEGNIETHDFMTGAPRDIEARIHAALEAGKGRRLILCPSSGYMENVEPTPREIENWLCYLEEGVRCAEELRG